MCGIQMGGYQGEKKGWGFFCETLWDGLRMTQRFTKGYPAETCSFIYNTVQSFYLCPIVQVYNQIEN